MSELREELSGSVQLQGASFTLHSFERLCKRARELGADDATFVRFGNAQGALFPSVVQVTVPVQFQDGAA